ncbi:hypothetical protein RSW84_26010, partial [Escherichia coli]|uniref:hypothetical protein n=1 Tax=Escherichia coli TaxID=562 RepID=UPI0028DE6B33
PDDLDVFQATSLLNLDRGQSVENVGTVYHPALVLQAEARYADRKARLDFTHHFTALIEDLPDGLVRWPTMDDCGLTTISITSTRVGVR